MSDAFVRDWIWILAFFPLWFVSSGTMLGLAYGPKQSMGARGQKLTNACTLVLSIAFAAGALMWLECASYIHLPFARPACGLFNPNLYALYASAWL